MAGMGTRFSKEGFTTPKPLIEVDGLTLIEHSINSLGLNGNYIFITRRYDNPDFNVLLTNKLKQLKPECHEIILDSPTRGSVESCLSAIELINDENPLVITNCDQITDWNPKEFSDFIESQIADGIIVTYTSENPKNSFAVLDKGEVTELVEKNPVSNIALIGVHYWRQGKFFVNSAQKLMMEFEVQNKQECYVSETYNYLIRDNLRILNYHIPNNQYIPLGTPYDVKVYLGKLKEFYTEKPKTIFCDLDGTILKHLHRFSDINSSEPELLSGVIEKINQWDSLGHKIIFVTARKESARKMTEHHLIELGLCWDQLIMGVTSGDRIIINDKLNYNNKDRCVAINVITNSGFDNIDWESYKL